MATSDKACLKCGRLLPATRDYFYSRSDSPDGLRRTCKECMGQKFGQFKNLDARPGYRRCTRCRQEFPATHEWFYRKPGGKGDLSSACRECLKAEERAIRRDPAHRIRAREYERDYWNKRHNKSRRTAARRENMRRRRRTDQYKAWYAEYRQRDKTRKIALVASQRRHAAKRNLPNSFTVDEWQECLTYWQGRCCICGREKGLWHTIAQEHWIPLSDQRPDNPGTVAWNILPMCHAIKGSNGQGACNNLKHTRDPIEFLYSEFPRKQADRILERVRDYFDWIRKQERGD